MKTVIKRNTVEIDAAGQAVGRVATQIAKALMGKNSATFERHIDRGDKVVVHNASKVKFTGKKLVQKDYYHHTMHPGGIKRTPLKKVFDAKPHEVIERAVYGMLPKNRQRDELMKRLIVNK
ncbi:MAG: 50S ribosomal protein L13 [Candidatus Magasanikbacteria bacterium]